MVKFFGWEFRKTEAEEKEQNLVSFSPEQKDDGAAVIAAGGSYGTYVDIEGSVRSEADLVTKYREMALQPEIEEAIDAIVNEAMDTDDNDRVSINLDKVQYSDKVKKRIREEFDTVLDLLDFNKSSYDLFRRWYIDGRIYYHAIIDPENPSEGLKELRYIDPRKLRKVREITRERHGQITISKTKNEYFVYSETGYNKSIPTGTSASPVDYGSVGGMKISKDTMVHVTSGLLDKTNSVVLSHLHKAIRPMNSLRAIEDATIIYTLARAPERRIFYIDVGDLPKAKAEQYLRDMMTRHKNKLVYDQTTGEIKDDRKYMNMLEDFWFPRREGNRTEVTTLPSGGKLTDIENVTYFQKKLYKSLNVPPSRLEGDSGFSLGRSNEVTRDELKFSKFVGRLRNRFSHLFYDALKKQLILKRVISSEDWRQLSNDIVFDFAIDNYFSELKYAEILTSRVETLSRVEPYVGQYYSKEWVRKNILMQTDDDIREMDKQIAADGSGGVGADDSDDDTETPRQPPPPPSTPAPDRSVPIVPQSDVKDQMI
jgi:hypothetical protein